MDSKSKLDDTKIMYYPRALKKRWFELSDQFPVLLLTGPRQIGKTTFLHHISEPTRQYVTLDDPDIRLLANKDPALFSFSDMLARADSGARKLVEIFFS